MCLVRENASDEIIKINNESDAYELVKDELINSDREMLLLYQDIHAERNECLGSNQKV